MERILLAALMGAFLCWAGPAHGRAPALREQVSLNGSWHWDGRAVAIPQYFGEEFTGVRVYTRTVDVPADWKGKRVKLVFNQIAHSAKVFVDDHVVATQIGGWAMFDADITEHVTAGKPFTLAVELSGSEAVKNARGMLTHPVGNWMGKAGINDDVWLRAYGPLHIDDAFIKTSYRRRELSVVYTLRNAGAEPRDAVLRGRVRLPAAAGVVKTLESRVSLAAGETKQVTLAAPWPDAALYWPDQPKLYHLESGLAVDGRGVDRETRRFGFREIWCEGNRIYWNGVRANLYGDYQSINTSGYHTDSSDLSPQGWPGTIEQIKAMNVRCLRFHHQPVPLYLLEAAEEKGLLICSEAPNYARNYHAAMNDAERWDYVANFSSHIAPGWIRRERNLASVYVFNATNEMTYKGLGQFSADQCRTMGAAIRRLDGSRPVGYDGDANNGVAEDSRNVHYPNGYNDEPTGSIYSMTAAAEGRQRLSLDMPTGTGEMLHTNDGQLMGKPEYRHVIRNRWWLGFWLRGLRYTDWTDVRPACYWFAANDLAGRPSRGGDPGHVIRGQTLQNALAPVALFDKAYDDQGLGPYVGDGISFVGRWPELECGSVARRTLVLYNDDFRGERVTAEVRLTIDDATVASDRLTLSLPLGEHREIACRLSVPQAPGKPMSLVLRTEKDGRERFREERRFRLVEGPSGGGQSAGSGQSAKGGAAAVELSPLSPP